MPSRQAPGWRHLALLAALYFGGAKLGMVTVMPEGMAIFWPPNAVVLAMLLRFDGARLPAIGAVVVAAELLADMPAFSLAEAALFGLINFGESTAAFLLLRRLGFDPRFRSLADLWHFMLAAPLLAALGSALCGAAVYTMFRGAGTGYLEFVRIWWFGDGLGLMVLTPLLLGFPPLGAAVDPRAFRAADAWFIAAAALGVAAIWLSLAPVVLLMPFVLYAGARYAPRWAALVLVVCVAVVVALMTQGRQPFGALPEAEAVTLAQRLIFILSIVGLGFSSLITRLRAQQAELEERVAARTAELQRANEELARVARMDALTGVANRRAFDEALAEETARVGRYGGTLSLVLVDIDRFKHVNDAHGHAAGDEVIRAFGRVLRECARGRDLVARYGGEEFAVLLPQTSLEQALAFAERARLAVAGQAALPAGVRITASFGVVELRPGEQPDQLVAAADAALYRAKSAGRDRVEAAPGTARPAGRVSLL